MNTDGKGFKVTDPSKKYKYGYGMHSDLVRPRYSPPDLVDPTTVIDPDLREIKRSLKLDLERNSE